jgi:hypothetical protein
MAMTDLAAQRLTQAEKRKDEHDYDNQPNEINETIHERLQSRL